MSGALKKTKKRKQKQKPTREDDIPPDLKDFISSIALYKPEENGDEKKKEKEEKKVEKPEKKQQHQFTELEVMTLWNSFKIDFPEDTINKIQLNELVTQLFPKCNAEIVIDNLFKVFDTKNTGQVVPTELLMAFSMSMKGSVEQKLHWTFKLYDKDGSGEIDPEEMEEIFTKLCKIAQGIEDDQKEIQDKEKEKERAVEEKKNKKEEEKELELMRRKRLFGYSEPVYYSKKMTRLVEKELQVRRNSLKVMKETKEKATTPTAEVTEDSEKKKVLETILKELRDPDRNMHNFDPGKRARELFAALDDDGNGTLDEDEFVQGCLSDEAFVKLLEDFNGDLIWGSQ